jgi:hypothetical protein
MAKKKAEAIQTIIAEIIKGLSSADHKKQDVAKNKLDALGKKGFSRRWNRPLKRRDAKIPATKVGLVG